MKVDMHHFNSFGIFGRLKMVRNIFLRTNLAEPTIFFCNYEMERPQTLVYLGSIMKANSFNNHGDP